MRDIRELQTFASLPACRHHRHKLVLSCTSLARAWQPGWLGMKNSWQRLLVLESCNGVTTHGLTSDDDPQVMSPVTSLQVPVTCTCPSDIIQRLSALSVSSLLNSDSLWLAADVFLIFEPSGPGSDWSDISRHDILQPPGTGSCPLSLSLW